MVEIWFSILTKQQVRRGVYHDVPELIAAIETFIEGYNERAQPFVWTKTAETRPRQGHQTPSHFRNAALVADVGGHLIRAVVLACRVQPGSARALHEAAERRVEGEIGDHWTVANRLATGTSMTRSSSLPRSARRS